MKKIVASFVWITSTLLSFGQSYADEIAWERIENGSVEAAFAKAKAENKPLFLYWGAVWCPPCNQVKATVFTRKDFVAQTKLFVPIYLDGDAAGAQKIAKQFNVRAYPTTILLKSDGKEIMRLPGEVDPLRYVQLLTQGLRSTIPMADLVKRATSAKQLPSKDWETLAFYSWDLDDANIVPVEERAKLLRELALACPEKAAVAKQRLLLKALALHGTDKQLPLKQSVDVFATLVKDNRLARPLYDIVLNSPRQLVEATAKLDKTRSETLGTLTSSLLDAAADDSSLSWNDRLQALSSKYTLLSETQKKAPPSTWVTQVKLAVAAANNAVKSKFERQSVIPSAADLLASYGLIEESNQLLNAELPRAVAPYYHMLVLAANAKKQNKPAAAVDWAQKAYESAQGSATKIQWGASYVHQLIEMAPTEASRIESAVVSIIQGLEPIPETFYERNARSLNRIGVQLIKWNKSPEQAAVLQRVRTELDRVCRKLPPADPARAVCDSSFNGAT